MIWLVIAALIWFVVFYDRDNAKIPTPYARLHPNTWKAYAINGIAEAIGSVSFPICLVRGLTELGVLK